MGKSPSNSMAHDPAGKLFNDHFRVPVAWQTAPSSDQGGAVLESIFVRQPAVST